MIQGIFLGIGAGLGLYVLASLFKKAVKSDRPTRAGKLEGAATRPAGLVSEGPVKSDPEATASRSGQGPELRADRPTPEEARSGMQWFVIQTKKGNLKLRQARTKTPKTVDGPFPTKEAAILAKKRHETPSEKGSGSLLH